MSALVILLAAAGIVLVVSSIHGASVGFTVRDLLASRQPA